MIRKEQPEPLIRVVGQMGTELIWEAVVDKAECLGGEGGGGVVLALSPGSVS